MGKGGKIVVFIIVAFVLALLATLMKNAGAGAVMGIAGVAIFILYQALFKKSKPNDKQNEDKDITLNK
jgi:4-hydroxybenzoate polyprenyltransferase